MSRVYLHRDKPDHVHHAICHFHTSYHTQLEICIENLQTTNKSICHAKIYTHVHTHVNTHRHTHTHARARARDTQTHSRLQFLSTFSPGRSSNFQLGAGLATRDSQMTALLVSETTKVGESSNPEAKCIRIVCLSDTHERNAAFERRGIP